MAVGSTVGALLGAGLGSVTGVGPSVGATVGGGIGQLIDAQTAKRKKDALPPAEDVGERQLRQYYRRQRKQIETGTKSMRDVNALRQMMAQGAKTSFRMGGGPRSNYLSNLYSSGMTNIANRDQQQLGQLMGLESKLVTDMANTRRDLALLPRAEESAQQAQQIQAGSQNLLAGAAQLDINDVKKALEERKKRREARKNSQETQQQMS
jgi:hypothetical protein